MSNDTVFVHHVAITAPANILEQVAQFYDVVLNLKPGFRPKFGGIGGQWLYAGDQPIIHLLEDPGRAADKSGYFDHFALRCTDFDAVVSRLEKAKIDFFRFDSEEVNQVQLLLADPSGTTVELNFQL